MMRKYSFLIGSTAALMAMVAETMNAAKYIEPLHVADFRRPKRRRTGKQYPHCGERQRARYIRQLAAGQISFIKHGPCAA